MNNVIDMDDVMGENDEIELEKKTKKEQEFIKLFRFDLITNKNMSDIFDKYKTSFNNKLRFSSYFKCRIGTIIYEIEFIIDKYCDKYTINLIEKNFILIEQIGSLLHRTLDFHQDGDLEIILRFLYLRDKIKTLFNSKIDLLLEPLAKLHKQI